MNRGVLTLVLLLAAWAGQGTGCRGQSAEQTAPKVAASNSLLECAVRDLLGDSTAVLRLAEPGMCPGHFDIRPRQATELRRCRLLLRLDFQKSLDSRARGSGGGPDIVEVRLTGGLAEPNSYLEACRQTADALVAAGLLDRAAADERLEAIARRINARAAECLRQVADLRDAPVLASSHQAAFSTWLGLDVAGTFTGADTATVGQIDQAVRQGRQAGVKLIIANRPEGRRVADALAEPLGARVVVFDNFPAMTDGQSSFDALLADNISRLLEAARP